jgi:hypothetical protein
MKHAPRCQSLLAVDRKDRNRCTGRRRQPLSYLEAHPSLDLFTKYLSDGLVEVGHDLDGKLRLNTTAADEIV